MKRAVFFGVLIACAAFQGCKGKTDVIYEAMGEASPEFGKSSSDLKSFMVGRWCVIAPMAGLLKNRYYEFKADGTFECGIKGGDWVSTGKYVPGPTSAQLTYVTMKGKPFEAFRAEYKKDEEGGGQVSVSRALVYDGVYDELGKMTAIYLDDDKKHLSFSPPAPANPNPGGGEEGGGFDLTKVGGFALERMSEKKGG